MTSGFLKGFLLALFSLVLLSGCASEPKRLEVNTQNSVPMQEVKPLATELNDQQQYHLALDVAQLQLDNNELAKAESLLKKLRHSNPDDIEIYRLLTILYEKQAKLDMALISAEMAISKPASQKKDEQIYARLALLNEQYLKADNIYQQWLTLSQNPSIQVIALNNLGFSALLQGKLESAKDYFNQALKLDPLNEKARNNLKLIETTVQARKQP